VIHNVTTYAVKTLKSADKLIQAISKPGTFKKLRILGRNLGQTIIVNVKHQ